MKTETDSALRCQELERWLLTEFGPVLRGRPLHKLLGHLSPDAFRQALRRHGAPVPLFLQEGRKGWCAYTRDVAHWIVRTEAAVIERPSPPTQKGNTP